MSNKLRNPFKIRASEKIDSDAGFLRLFSPLVLESLEENHVQDKLWGNVLYIHSSPGAGKSSLIRVFEPASLKILLNGKSAPDHKELFTSLKKIEVIDEQGINVLAVVMQCTRNYEILEELNVSEAMKNRLFFSLLNSRIILATLRNVCVIKDKKFPDQLNLIEFEYNNDSNHFKSLNVPCNGKELYEWASEIERNIYRVIDSFLPMEDNQVEGHDELFALETLASETITIEGQQVCKKLLFVLDDAHKLSNTQRKSLKKYLTEKRGNFTIWISERLEALDSVENIGSYLERDYNEINLESFWRNNTAKFEKILRSISDKRANISTEDVSSFQNYLLGDLNEEVHKEALSNYTDKKLVSLQRIADYNNKFTYWLEYLLNYSENEESVYQKALKISETEILIHRSLGKLQLSFEFPMTVEELHDKVSSDVTSAALLFLSKETNLPYYYGFKNLTKLSSSNIEQFLSFASILFEEMISNKLSGKNITISDVDQDRLIKEVVKQKWKELERIVPFSTQVIRFLSSLGEFAKKETYKSNAPYSPGVSGFAIKEEKGLKLIPEESIWHNNPVYEPLVNVISTCVAYNLLEIQKTNQGKKGQSWDVYYLNRWLCVFFELPLSYGGWRHKSPNDLTKWIKK